MSLIVDHKNAVIARVEEDTVLAQCGFEGVVQPGPNGKRPERYWTLFTDSGPRTTDRLAGQFTSATLRYWIHCVGSTPEQAQMLADRVIGKLAGWTPTVTGYRPFRIVHESSQPLQMDAQVRDLSGQILHYTVDQFALPTQVVPA